MRSATHYELGGALAVFAIVYFASPAKLVVQPTETPGALESEVTLDAGTYDAVQLIQKLTEFTGGITLDPKLASKLQGRAVQISSRQNSVALKTVLDHIFTKIGIAVDYPVVSGTVVISEKEAS